MTRRSTQATSIWNAWFNSFIHSVRRRSALAGCRRAYFIHAMHAASADKKPKRWRKSWGRASIVMGLVIAGFLLLMQSRDGVQPEASELPAVQGAESARTMDARRVFLPDSFMKLLDRFKNGLAPAAAVAALGEMEGALRALPRDKAVTALLAFLDSGADAATGLDFKLGSGGILASAPTLRVWALDHLGRIDAVVAASYAARIYARHDSADEWAVALRNDWRVAAPAGRIEPVRARVLELLADEAWAKQPSVGFLEAFDVAVATMAWEAVPRLEQWLGLSQPKALRAGAWIAFDRLTMEVPSDFLPTLVQRREWLASQPLVRAGLVARADLKVELERRAVETYLQRDDVSKREGARFLELLPNVSATVSHNLVTPARITSPAQAASRDQASLASVRDWRGQAQFSRWNDELAAAETRLAEAVASAVRGGYLQP